MAKMIALSRGLFATVDGADFEWLNQWKWSALRTFSKRHGERFYAVRTVGPAGNQVTILMHRLLTGAEKGQIVDHEDRDSLNNRRVNLRCATQAQNCLNRIGVVGTSSTLKGVWFHRKNNNWVAEFRGRHLGCFPNEGDAGRAYDAAALAYDPAHSLTNAALSVMPAGSHGPAPARVNSSRHKGVTWNRRGNKWVAQWRGVALGRFADENEAAAAVVNHLKKVGQ